MGIRGNAAEQTIQVKSPLSCCRQSNRSLHYALHAWSQLLLANEVDSLSALLHTSLADLELEGTGTDHRGRAQCDPTGSRRASSPLCNLGLKIVHADSAARLQSSASSGASRRFRRMSAPYLSSARRQL